MAKLKLKKLPKKPKKSASVASKQKYLDKVKEITEENRNIVKENKLSDDLDKKIAGIGSLSMKTLTTRTAKRKTTKRSTGGTKKKTTGTKAKAKSKKRR